MDVVFGTFAGTGAAIHVCLGFTPSYVELLNVSDATDRAHMIWHKSMLAVSAVDEGVEDKTSAALVRAAVTSAGISPYAGGDSVVYSAANERWETPAGADATEVYLDGFYNRSDSGDDASRPYGFTVVPDPSGGEKIKTTPGFTVGTNADVNTDGEQIVFKAYR